MSADHAPSEMEEAVEAARRIIAAKEAVELYGNTVGALKEFEDARQELAAARIRGVDRMARALLSLSRKAEEPDALLSANEVMAEIEPYASEPVMRVLRDSYGGKHRKDDKGKIAAVVLRDLALEPVMMFRRKVSRDQTPAHLRSLPALIEEGE